MVELLINVGGQTIRYRNLDTDSEEVARERALKVAEAIAARENEHGLLCGDGSIVRCGRRTTVK